MRNVIISVPVIAYKDWKIWINSDDEDEEEKFINDIKKIYPYRENVEKVK